MADEACHPVGLNLRITIVQNPYQPVIFPEMTDLTEKRKENFRIIQVAVQSGG